MKKKPIKMGNKVQISATIVLFKEDFNTLQETIDSFLKTPLSKKLFLVDNSPNNILERYFQNPQIEYIFVGKNIGFGRAHNLVLNKIKTLSEFHLILNPDVAFKPTVLPKMIKKFRDDSTVSMISPQIISPEGKIQYTCRKNPTFLKLIIRRLDIFKNYSEKNDYRNQDLSVSFHPEFIHGCFMLFTMKDFITTQGFDERYFLYMEDADICREQYIRGKKILYFPEVTIKHKHQRGSSKRIKLFFNHLISALKYFKKWKF